MKKILIHTSYFFILLLVSTLLLTIIDYFSLFNIKIIRGIKLLIPILSLAIISYILGKSALKKGYIEGIKLGSIVILIFTIFILLFDKYQVKTLLFDFILLLTSMLSSMIGINQRKKNEFYFQKHF